MDCSHQIINYLHSALRTCGQYILVSFGLLVYSRFYREKKNVIYNIVFIILSLIILFIASLICYFLSKDINIFLNDCEDPLIYKWLIIPKLIFATILIIAFFGLVTLIRELLYLKT